MAHKITFTLGCLFITLVLILPSNIHAQNGDEVDSVVDGVAENTPTSAIIDVASLQSKIASQAKIKIVDVVTDRAQYMQGHIPGAVFVHWIDDIIDQKQLDRYNLIGAANMQVLLRRLGISRDDHIIVYDSLSNRLATRLYWSLKVYDHPRVSVVDGGRNAWLKQGGILTTKVPQVTPSDYQIQKTNKGMFVDMSFVADHLGDSKVTLIDGRPPEQYSGEQPGAVFHTGQPHKLRGHIPGAVHVFWKDNFNEDGTFKSIDELKLLYRKAGAQTGNGQTVVTYCNEGLHAAPPWFVLRELLGVKDVRVYDDSMSEWANSDQPVEKSEPTWKTPAVKQ